VYDGLVETENLVDDEGEGEIELLGEGAGAGEQLVCVLDGGLVDD